MQEKEISQAVIRRMPRYYRYLGELLEDGVERISSNDLSKRMNVTASQIRQDLNNFGGFGQQGYGYNVKFLYEEIGKILGLNQKHNIIVIGAGNLGQALANYVKFEKLGFVITALFDVNPALEGVTVRGIKIHMLDELDDYCKDHVVDIAALTIPKKEAVSMKDKELRKLIGSRIKQRRLELNLTQPYVAEKMGVTASTILRYENGSIDNTKKMVLEGLSEALHVSVEWLKGETDEYETDITDKRELQIRDAMGDILEQLPLALTKEEDAFSKDLLLLMLKQYGLFLDSFQFACKNFKGNAGQTDIAKTIGFESNEEYNEIMFLREITHTINAFNEMADIVRLYSKKPKTAEQRLANLLSEVLYEDSESV